MVRQPKLRKMKKKERGILDDMLPMVVFILLFAVLIFIFIEYNTAINKKTTINNIARNHLLKIETTGYMTDPIKLSLAAALKKEGFKADADGTEIDTSAASNLNWAAPTSAVGYGNEIYLTFTVYTQNYLMMSGGLFSPTFNGEYVPITVTYYSTSKE